MKCNVLVVGLGLIGGSMARAMHEKTDCIVMGEDCDDAVLADARAQGIIAEDAARMDEVDLLLLGLYPSAAIAYARAQLPQLKRGCVIVDLCGVKQYIADALVADAIRYGVEYIGGHPMAGRELSGFSASCATLFDGASMVLVPNDSVCEQTVVRMEEFFRSLGFGKTVRTTAAQHDDMIAYTSQLAHVVSSAYIKSPEALLHDGYSAGSYKDLTRVAQLNAPMWTELFLRNAAPLTREIDEVILHLIDYRDAIAKGEEETLLQLLQEGSARKKMLG